MGLSDAVEVRLTDADGEILAVSQQDPLSSTTPVRPSRGGHVRLKGRVSEPGRRPWIEVTQQFDRWNHDRQRPEDVTTYVNRETDEYFEVWTLPGTADVTWEQHEPLSQHRSGMPRSGGPPPD